MCNDGYVKKKQKKMVTGTEYPYYGLSIAHYLQNLGFLETDY